ncbi:hypothetical protein LPJ71_004436 [Coemansia sp. S17]|nr:hypothetical protein LPJ71_004436 [Coemansia sp. S17]
MFAGIKLLWLVAGKVLTAITIQFDNFNPFDEPDDPEPHVVSRFLCQLYLNDKNSSVPRTGGITHIPYDEADDDGSDDDGDNAGANVNLPEERTQAVDTSGDTILPEQRALDDDAGVDNGSDAEDAEQVSPFNDMADGDGDAEDTERRAQVDDARVDNVGDAEDAEQVPPSSDMADGDGDAKDTEQRAQVDDARVDNGSDAEDAEQVPPSSDMADGDGDAEDTEQRAQVDDAGSQPEETSATDAPIQDATLVNDTGLLHVVEPPPAVIEMEAVNPPVEVDIEERPPVADFDMADAGPPADSNLEERPPVADFDMADAGPPADGDLEERPPVAELDMADAEPSVDGNLEERPPVADFDMADAGPPVDDDLDMGNEDSASDDDVQIEAFAQVLEAAKIEAKMEELRRPHRQPRLRRPVNAAAAPLPISTFKFEASLLPPTPVSPAAGTFNVGSFSLGNTGRDQFRGNPGAPLHQVNADEDGSSDDDEFDELANDIEAGLKNDAYIPTDNSGSGGNEQAGGEQAANKQDDGAQVDSPQTDKGQVDSAQTDKAQTDKAQVQKAQTDSEWDDREQEYSEQPDDEQIDYEKVENVLRLYSSLSRFEQDWLMDQALSGNQAAYTAPAATGATAFSFNRARVSAEEVLGLYNGLSDEERLELVDRMAPEE